MESSYVSIGLAISTGNWLTLTDNIDYEDIKHFIKEQTTPGAGKSVSIPGRGNDKLADFETALFRVLQDQHERIDLFVQSKSGEIQRRIGMSLRIQ